MERVDELLTELLASEQRDKELFTALLEGDSSEDSRSKCSLIYLDDEDSRS